MKSFKLSTGFWKINSNCMTRQPITFIWDTKIHTFVKINKQQCKHQTGPLWPKIYKSIACLLKKMKTKDSLWQYHEMKLLRKHTVWNGTFQYLRAHMLSSNTSVQIIWQKSINLLNHELYFNYIALNVFRRMLLKVWKIKS